MPMDRKRYPEDWDRISERIRFERAKGKCEQCGAVNRERHPVTGSKVVLTVHHIGIDKPDGSPGDRHDKMDVRDANLIALCQRCHWIADWDIHFAKAQIARAAKAAQGQMRLFEGESNGNVDEG